MMKPMTKALIAAGLLSASVVAQAGLSANIGAMSDYYYRGLDQTTGGSMMGGVDYEHDNGLYVGLWTAQMADGEFEYDIYGGYAGEVESVSYSVGYTGYFYNDYNGDYQELNLSVGYGPVTLAHNIGTNNDDAGDTDYTFTSLTGEYEGAYLTYGTYGDDVDGDYFELGYGVTYEGLDLSVAYIDGDDEGDSWVSDGETITFAISKTFDF